MRNIVVALAAIVLLAGPASADTILVEDFEEPFPQWESGWLGTHTNIQNAYGVGGNRGNNPDGLWIVDGDSLYGESLVTIFFDSEFAATLSAFSIDVASWANGTFSVFDATGATLLSDAFLANQGAYTDPGTYVHFAVTSQTGIGGFSLASTNQVAIEGNTSIDNVTVTVREGPVSVPEPSSLLLFGAGLAGLLAHDRRRAHHG